MASSSASSRAPLLLLHGMRSPLTRATITTTTTTTTTTTITTPLSTPIPRQCRRHYADSAKPKPNPKAADPNKPILLEQPTKFVPPSHPSRRHDDGGWSMPKMYGRKWTEHERAESNTRWYPGLMAPVGSWEHWFWHSRAVHTWITMGTLVSLAVSTFILNFTTNSPFRHELPENALFWQDPIEFVSRWRHVIRLHDEDRNKKLVEMRNRQADDALKRRQYMRAHGIETEGVLGKLIKSDDEEATAEKEEKVPVTKVGERMARSGGQ